MINSHKVTCLYFLLIATCPLKTPHIPSSYNNEQTTKETKAIDNSYIYIHISCKCDTNRAGHFTLDAHASRPVACLCIRFLHCMESTQWCSMTRPCIFAWWRHQMETFSAWLALCAGKSPVPVNFPHKGQSSGALMFSLICAWINHWVNNRDAGDLRRHRGHYDVNVMQPMS